MIQLNDLKKYILVLATNEDRLNNANYLKNTYFNDLEFKYVINSPFDNISMDKLNKLPQLELNIWKGKFPHYKNINEFSCAFEHYRIIKEAYILKYPYVLVIEDDIAVEYNIDLINKFLYHAPEKFDMLKLGYWPHNIITQEYEDTKKLYEEDGIYWVKSNDMLRYGTQANIYSYNGMRKYLKFQEKTFCTADLWTYIPNNDKKYISTIPLFKESNKSFKSTIHKS